MVDAPLRVWVMPTDVGTRALERLDEALQRMHPELKEFSIDWRIVPWNTVRLELLRAYKVGQLPDVFQLGTTWLSSFASLNCLSEPPKDIQEIPVVAPWMKDVTRYRGVQYAAPWLLDTTSFQVRPDIMERLNISDKQLQTWDGFLAACVEVHHATPSLQDLGCKAPIALPLQPNSGTLHRLVPWLWAGGWDLANRDRWMMDDGIEPGLRLFGSLIELEKAQVEFESTHLVIDHDYFQHGRYAFLSGAWTEVVRRKTNPGHVVSGIPTKSLPLPQGPAGTYVFGGGSVLAVSSQSTQQERAWNFVRCLISVDTAMYWASISGFAPMQEGGFWRQYEDDPDMKILKSSLQTAQYYPKEELWVHIENLLNSGVSDLMWILSRHGYSEAQMNPVRRDYDAKIKRLLDLNWGMTT